VHAVRCVDTVHESGRLHPELIQNSSEVCECTEYTDRFNHCISHELDLKFSFVAGDLNYLQVVTAKL
jgi:hypothetical protein